MSRVIFISPYLKGGKDAAALSNRTRYIATREGVEKLKDDNSSLAPTVKQEEFISRVLKQFPEAKELLEYENYRDKPSRKTASEFIEQAWEQHILTLNDREHFLDYVSHRPGVKRQGDHGLWDANGKVENLAKAMEEVANHQGNVWTPVVTIRRADAERLGYTDVDNWRALVNASINEIAEAYKIAPNNLRWYAALHEKDVNYHIHMVIFSTDPKEGFLTKEGIRKVKSTFARHIFEQDLISTYERQTEYRNTLQHEAESRMKELIDQMQSGAIQNMRVEQLVEELAARLKDTKGKKVYGYLPAPVKRIVDEIVDELSRDERVSEAYLLWQEMRDEVCKTYSNTPPERRPLSQEKEFKPVRNMVIREALKLSEEPLVFDDERMDDETEQSKEKYADAAPKPTRAYTVYDLADRYRKAKKVLYDEGSDASEKHEAVAELKEVYSDGFAVAAHQLGKCFRDGLGVERDIVEAVRWFRQSADEGLDCSEYALGKLLLEQGSVTEGIGYLVKAAAQDNTYAQYRLGKVYLSGEQTEKDVETALSYLRRAAERGNQWAQYAVGKLLLLGEDVERDIEQAVQYLSMAAAQGNVYAQFFLDHKDDWQKASIGAAVVRMLHHMSQIFQDNFVADSTYLEMQIDRKRRREMRDKRIAMGHKPDDHEESDQQTMR